MKRLLCFLILFFALAPAPAAHAIKTASSFDLSWASALLNLTTTQVNGGSSVSTQKINSYTGLQLDYNVAIFDYRTVATIEFAQFQTSTLGPSPLSRIAVGASYHLFRINGQRIILDNQVEGKVWGVSPAIELSLGLSRLSVNGGGLDFTASLIDAIPRLLIEVPMSSSFLLMLRAGSYMTVSGSSTQYKISLSGTVFNIGFKLTTL